MKTMKFLLIAMLLALHQNLKAQGGQDPKGGRSDTTLHAVPWPHLREADMIYRKRVWRVIDLREKNNKVLTWPKNAYTDLIMEMARNGKLPVYESTDSMVNPLNLEKVHKATSYTMVMEVIDSSQLDGRPIAEMTPEEIPTTPKDILVPRRWQDIQSLRIMEEWIFDKEHGVMIVRIISIQPMVDVMVNGNSIGTTEPMFTINYSQLRPLMAKQKVFNPGNGTYPLSFDEYFERRLFNSYIIKESNVYDYFIKGLPEFEKDNLGALLEADRIKLDLFTFEHDLWEY